MKGIGRLEVVTCAKVGGPFDHCRGQLGHDQLDPGEKHIELGQGGEIARSQRLERHPSRVRREVTNELGTPSEGVSRATRGARVAASPSTRRITMLASRLISGRPTRHARPAPGPGCRPHSAARERSRRRRQSTRVPVGGSERNDQFGRALGVGQRFVRDERSTGIAPTDDERLFHRMASIKTPIRYHSRPSAGCCPRAAHTCSPALSRAADRTLTEGEAGALRKNTTRAIVSLTRYRGPMIVVG
jgi:hypothetical protein